MLDFDLFFPTTQGTYSWPFWSIETQKHFYDNFVMQKKKTYFILFCFFSFVLLYFTIRNVMKEEKLDE